MWTVHAQHTAFHAGPQNSSIAASAARCQVLWPKDMFHGGNRGCRDGTDARLMRALLHAMHGTRLPPAGAAPPATITLQRKSANRRIVNEKEVVDMLREFGEVCGQRVALARVAEARAWAANSRGMGSRPPGCASPCYRLTLPPLPMPRCESWSSTRPAA